jgi:hypothetical protein
MRCHERRSFGRNALVVGTAGGQALQHDVGRSGAGLERGGDAHELVPLLNDQGGVEGAGEQVGHGIGDHRSLRTPEALVDQILEARHEVDAEQMAQGAWQTVGGWR